MEMKFKNYLISVFFIRSWFSKTFDFFNTTFFESDTFPESESWIFDFYLILFVFKCFPCVCLGDDREDREWVNWRMRFPEIHSFPFWIFSYNLSCSHCKYRQPWVMAWLNFQYRILFKLSCLHYYCRQF